MRLRVLTVLLTFFCATSAARADPFPGGGEASVSEFKKGTVELARRRALRRARGQALEAALERLPGPIDRQARRAVLRSGDAWTGAYRVLSETVHQDTVRISLEVEVDLARLAKRVMPRPSGETAPMYRFGQIERAEGCEERIDERLRTELEGVGALGAAKGTPVSLRIACRELGSVPHTFVFASQVELEVRHAEHVLGSATATGLGAGASASQAIAVQQVVETVGAMLAAHRRGRVLVRVQSPLPAARIRRLERAVGDSVMGVAGAQVVGIDPGGDVRLQVQGDLSAETLARRLEALRLPGFSVNIVGIEGPDALTIRLQ